jgi:hypothetical protein
VGADVRAADADYIVQSAGGGGYYVSVEGYILNMAFGDDATEGKHLYDAYAAVGVDGFLGRSENVVMAWDDTPPGNVEKLVRGCLRTS